MKPPSPPDDDDDFGTPIVEGDCTPLIVRIGWTLTTPWRRWRWLCAIALHRWDPTVGGYWVCLRCGRRRDCF